MWRVLRRRDVHELSAAHLDLRDARKSTRTRNRACPKFRLTTTSTSTATATATAITTSTEWKTSSHWVVAQRAPERYAGVASIASELYAMLTGLVR